MGFWEWSGRCVFLTWYLRHDFVCVWIDVHFNVPVSEQCTQSCVGGSVKVIRAIPPKKRLRCRISHQSFSIHSQPLGPATHLYKTLSSPFHNPKVDFAVLCHAKRRTGARQRNYSPLKTWSSAQDSDGCPGIMELTSVDWKQTERETKEYKWKSTPHKEKEWDFLESAYTSLATSNGFKCLSVTSSESERKICH